MRKIIGAIALAAFVAGPAAASDKTDVLALLQKSVDSFNKGESLKSVLKALCADQTTLLDNTPPYEWHGDGACDRYAADSDAFTKKHEVTEPAVTLGKARHIEIAGDRAYVVIPVSATYKVKGKPAKETAEWTVALQKGAAGWRVNAWTYTAGKVQQVEAAPAK